MAAMDSNTRNFMMIAGVLAATIFAALLFALAAVIGAVGGEAWLNFFGVIVGVIATVAATKLVDKILADGAKRRREKAMLDALNGVVAAIEKAMDPAPRRHSEVMKIVASFWRTAEAHMVELGELSFDERARLVVLKDMFASRLPDFDQLALQADVGVNVEPFLAGLRTLAGQVVIEIRRREERHAAAPSPANKPSS